MSSENEDGDGADCFPGGEFDTHDLLPIDELLKAPWEDPAEQTSEGPPDQPLTDEKKRSQKT
eukprot:CAMPEP_0198224136 /NCGR_PEP_ID=MMETSP1445-20131203/95536_1 /TAXON_ID=36898 /ORGANISM="Pyramimonas sp., Strain CCMP2087" /LENGTH=61 /DNA_ID=CAMNT_0043903195 /DNA_START=37 /DNA_END=218 /DNA_ORIENTATION=+